MIELELGLGLELELLLRCWTDDVENSFIVVQREALPEIPRGNRDVLVQRFRGLEVLRRDVRSARKSWGDGECMVGFLSRC